VPRRKADALKKRRKLRERQKTIANRDEIKSEPLEPVAVVERELTRPDGTTLRVKVPVYPPFQLKQRTPAKPARGNRVRKAS
jgi:hypothetical protein